MSSLSVETRIRENYQRVLERVAEAATRAGRKADEITVVGVTKYVDAEMARLLVLAGCLDLGESRPQALEEKSREFAMFDESENGPSLRWHMIGHLQRNKVARTIRNATLIHSVDSLRLTESISRHAADQDRTVDILLEVNVSGDTTKHGFATNDLEASLGELLQTQNIRLRGLMCMAGLGIDESETRNQFASLRNLRDSLKSQMPPEHQFNELSMGMSGDFELAIAEGATIVRVGSVLFEGVL